jgi:hypothetical protein
MKTETLVPLPQDYSTLAMRKPSHTLLIRVDGMSYEAHDHSQFGLDASGLTGFVRGKQLWQT